MIIKYLRVTIVLVLLGNMISGVSLSVRDKGA